MLHGRKIAEKPLSTLLLMFIFMLLYLESIKHTTADKEFYMSMQTTEYVLVRRFKQSRNVQN